MKLKSMGVRLIHENGNINTTFNRNAINLRADT